MAQTTAANARRFYRTIAQIAERAYRRGFEQGFATGTGEFQKQVGHIPTEQDIFNWRYATRQPRWFTGAPGTIGNPGCGRKPRNVITVIERLEIETDPEEQELLAQVIGARIDNESV